MSKPVRVGIIGCGVIAPVHAGSYQLVDGVEIAWACDLVEKKARRLAEKFGVANVTTDYREVLDDPTVDAVSVCTDHASHAPITVAALEADKHVLCEKALAASREGLDRMFAAHAAHPDRIFSGIFQHRFDGVNRLLKRLVDEGALGQTLTACTHVRCLRTDQYYAADKWRGTWDLEGGAVLINQAIHFLDAMLWITGGAEAACGAYANLTHGDVMETEDTVTASLRFRSGALGTLEATASSHLGWEPTIEIHGTEGSVELRGEKALKVEFSDAGRAAEVQKLLDEAVEARKLASGKSYYGSSHPAQIEDFVASVREGRDPFVPASSARHTVDVVFAIYQSHRDGRWVEIDSLP